MKSISQKIRVEIFQENGRRAIFNHNYLRGWIEVDASGKITAYELDISVASLKDRKQPLSERIGAVIAYNLPTLHKAYVRTGTQFAEIFTDEKILNDVVEKCQHAGPDNTCCEFLRDEQGSKWCGKCGCPTALKRGCPDGRW